MRGTDRDKAFCEKKRSQYLWCLHCQRTYKRGQFRKKGEYQMCPYKGCGGDAVIDAWDWQRIRDYNPYYPEIPEPDRVYPLDPK